MEPSPAFRASLINAGSPATSGADHQATAVDDATEASAGWYWQFNRKQGYKHTGTTVIPAWNTTSIDEDSDWIPANDPCAIELGAGWRIPT